MENKDYWQCQRWGSLTLVKDQNFPLCWAGKSNKKFKFVCDCSRTKITAMRNVTESSSPSCGKCNWKTKEEWLDHRPWGVLTLASDQKFPLEWGASSNIKFKFNCGCGKTPEITMQGVTSGNYTSCGHCDDQSRQYWLSKTWGSLKLNPDQSLPDAWGPMSQKYFSFLCKTCHNSARIRMCRVSLKSNTTCGKCNFQTKDYWLKQEWGCLTLDKNQNLPSVWSRNAVRKFYFLCSCGRRPLIAMHDVANSCGKCTYRSKEYWLKQKWGFLEIDKNASLPLEWGTGQKDVPCICTKCSSKKLVYMGHLVSGDLTSCGCTSPGNSPSSPATEIFNFIKSLCSDAVQNFWFIHHGDRRQYDIYIPSRKFAVEYHGLHWHMEKYRGTKDYDKFLYSREREDRLIQIYGDEWYEKEAVIKSFLTGILQPEKGKRIKPKFEVFTETSQEARDFLDEHHYLGAASGCLTTVAKHKSEIVGVWVFMKREAGTVLWHRACWGHKYKAWNPHQKALEMAKPLLKQMGFRRILTFSDNRFHTGDLYEKLGFVFEKELKPDYSYTDGMLKRKSKYAFRVEASQDEKNAAKDKGWYRIWDSGKRRYSLNLGIK